MGGTVSVGSDVALLRLIYQAGLIVSFFRRLNVKRLDWTGLPFQKSIIVQQSICIVDGSSLSSSEHSGIGKLGHIKFIFDHYF